MKRIAAMLFAGLVLTVTLVPAADAKKSESWLDPVIGKNLLKPDPGPLPCICLPAPDVE